MDGIAVDLRGQDSLSAMLEGAWCMEELASITSADATSLGSSAHAVHLFDYHLAYHPSYSVPILLFRGRQRGKEYEAVANMPLYFIVLHLVKAPCGVVHNKLYMLTAIC